ncbi:alpha/beta hydrolase [Streptomyces sp. 549]|uniref:alpha/beta fold hydrolase n=1 Tax=Streptomyces sp. 549 TaxID=3049076 RepID=UPI0024C4534B|nr:alpha/beta hydrolase [Streptomyces sp. 549]MDK1476034.1 alpha/beta hydrolase [Streptomyces sp. 549]
MSRRKRTVTGVYAPLEPSRVLTAVSPDGSRLHTEVHGPEDGPSVVLAHGWTCSTAFWAPVARRLVEDGHRVVLYDQRGHGRSPAPEACGYSTYALADDLCAVLEATLEDGTPAVVGGHSMGAMTIMAAAGRPQLAQHGAALMLCSTGARRLLGEARVLPFRGLAARTRAHRLLMGSRAPMGPVTALSRRALHYGTMGPGASPEQVEACARIVHACPRPVRASWGAVLGALDLSAKLPGLTAPTAVVAGTRDRLTPSLHARELAEALPHCTSLHELEGLGHMTPIEAPDRVADVLRDLVEDHVKRPGRLQTLRGRS